MSVEPLSLLRGMFKAALKAADPAVCVPPFVPAAPVRKDGKWGRTLVVGAGKAAARMARAVELAWPDKNHDAPIEGLVVTRYGHDVPCDHISVIEAAHPVPDSAGEKAAALILEKAKALTADDLLLCLISGGGSALLALPAPGLTLADKQAINQALLKSGASISEMNCVRKHLSAIKGGRLAAAAAPAQVVTLMISDVPGDDPAVIGSGPTVPDPTTFADARAVLDKYAIQLPPAVAEYLARAENETPKPGDPVFEQTRTVMVATPQMALEAAAKEARAAGYTPVILGDAIEGEAREVATVMAGIVSQIRRHRQPVAPPCVLLSGGETTVTVRGKGRGGRNTEFLTALAVALRNLPDGGENVWALAADTDGIDGSEDNAGAFLTPDSVALALAKGIDARACLADNDGFSFFQAAGGLVRTGPTLTNVNDFRAILIR